MKYILFFLILLNGFYISAQAFEYDWVQSGKGDQSTPGTAVVTDEEGNVYVTGSFNGNYASFGTHAVYNSGINSDIYIVKYDSEGNVLWAKGAGGHDEDVVNAMTTDQDNNIYITGRFNSTTMYFDALSVDNVSNSSIRSDVFLAKYDAEGNVLWAKAGNGVSHDDTGTSLCTDAGGNVYLGGRFASKMITFETVTLSNKEQSASDNTDDVFLVKYTSGGTLLWAKSAGGTGTDVINSIAADQQGNVFVGGNFQSLDWTFGNSILSARGGTDVFLAKYTPEGDIVWARSALGEEDDEFSSSVAIDQSGNAFLSGISHSSTFSFGHIPLNNTPGYTQTFIAKYSAQGNPVWARGVSSPGDQAYQYITIDAKDNIYFTGTFSFDSLKVGKFVLHGYGFYTSYMSIYNKSGQVLYATTLGNQGQETCNGIALDPQGKVCITGSFRTDDIDFGTTTLTNTESNTTDMFILKIKINPETLISTPHKFGFYPNPSDGIVTGSFLQLDHYTLNVYSLLGKLVYQSSIYALEQQINLSTLASGTYIFQLQNESGTIDTEKIVID